QRQDPRQTKQSRLRPRRLQRLIDSIVERLDIQQRQTRVELANLALKVCHHARYRTRSPHVQRHLRRVLLQQRDVHKRALVLYEACDFAVLRDRYHLAIVFVSKKLEALANRVVPRPKPSSHRLVDDHNGRSLVIVTLGEASSSYEGHAKGLKIVWPDVVGLNQNAPAARRRLLTLNEHASENSNPHRPISLNRGSRNSGHRRNSFKQLPVKLTSLRLAVALSTKVEADQYRVAGDEPRIHLARLLKAPHKQTRCHKRKQRQRNLRGHKTGPQVYLQTSTPNRYRHVSLQRHHKIRTRSL